MPLETQYKRLASSGDVDPQTVKMIGNHVLIRREFDDEKKGSLFVPDMARRPIMRGQIVSLGTDMQGEYKDLQIGMGVIVHGHAMVLNRFTWAGNTYDVIQSEDIEATYEVEIPFDPMGYTG
jgi:co-chaperonin GroES (HSP10)